MRDVRVVVAGPESADRVRQALGAALGGGPAVAVLPVPLAGEVVTMASWR